ncbi:MAG: PQQ-dependent sugar dehydrogenase [Planctomycetota bacterium]
MNLIPTHRRTSPLCSLAFWAAGLIAAGMTFSASAWAQNIRAVYAQNCAACHGANAEGGSAPSMLDDQWVTDGSDKALYDAIHYGLEDLGMPAYKGGLTEAQSWALVVYIRELRNGGPREITDPSVPDANGVYTTDHHRYRVEPVAGGLDRPWAIDFLPGGIVLVTERPGRLRLIVDGRLVKRPVAGTPEVWNRGQGGLLDVAVDPDYATAGSPGEGWVYLSYAEVTDDSRNRPRGNTAVVRGKLERRGGRWHWTDEQTLFTTTAQHASPAGVHFGSRFVFGDNHTLFFSIGDRGQQPRVQELAQPHGKVHRIHTDGSIPDDNPFAPGNPGAADHPDAMPSVWSLGHRNPQGLAAHPVTGELYDVEHGPRGGDEINLVRKGENYGWPVVSYSINYNQTPRGDNPPWHEPMGFVEPLHYWIPSLGQCGSNFYVGDAFPAWKHDFFVAALAKQEIRRVRFADDGVTVLEDEPIFRGLGRVRDVVTGPDGVLWVATEQPGLIRRLVPVD